MGKVLFRYQMKDDAALQQAVELYFQEHPEINPEQVSVILAADTGNAEYWAVGHEVIPAPAGAATADVPLEQLAAIAFVAYAAVLGHTNHTMDVADGWDSQGAEVKAGFTAAARAVWILCSQPPGTAPGLAHLEPGQ